MMFRSYFSLPHFHISDTILEITETGIADISEQIIIISMETRQLLLSQHPQEFVFSPSGRNMASGAVPYRASRRGSGFSGSNTEMGGARAPLHS